MSPDDAGAGRCDPRGAAPLGGRGDRGGAAGRHGVRGRGLAGAAWVAALLLPLAGLLSLLLRSKLDPSWEDHRVHFVLFSTVGGGAYVLALVAGRSAERRGDARVLLISLAFLATGGFIGLHAIGTEGVLFTRDLAGFKVAIPVGLLVAALFALASAFVDARPSFAPPVMRRRRQLRTGVLVAMALWLAWTVLELPPLSRPASEGAKGSVLAILSGLGAVVYAIAALRYWVVFRRGELGRWPPA